jgi:hypothetical protein
MPHRSNIVKIQTTSTCFFAAQIALWSRRKIIKRLFFHTSRFLSNTKIIFLSCHPLYAYNKVEPHKIKKDIGGNQCPIDTQPTARSAVARKADSNLPSLRPSRVGYFLSLDIAMTVTINDANAIINVSASAMVIISGTSLL